MDQTEILSVFHISLKVRKQSDDDVHRGNVKP